MKKNKNNKIKKYILNEIKKGKLTPKPKIYFIIKGSFVILGLIFSVLVFIYLVSFIIYFLKQSGVSYLPKFGLRGIWAFLSSFPWFLGILGVLLLLTIGVISRRYSFNYKMPIIYFIFIVLILIITGGYLINKTGIHPYLHKLSYHKKLPGLGGVYRSYEKFSPPRPIIGKVIKILDNKIILQDRSEKKIEVIIDDFTRTNFKNKLQNDDLVLIMGEKNKDQIKAFGIRKLPEKDSSFRRDFYMHPPFPPKHPLFKNKGCKECF